MTTIYAFIINTLKKRVQKYNLWYRDRLLMIRITNNTKAKRIIKSAYIR